MILKLKDIQTENDAKVLLDNAKELYYGALTEDKSPDNIKLVNESLVIEAIKYKDPTITETELIAQMKDFTADEIGDNVRLALDNKFNAPYIISVPKDDGSMKPMIVLGYDESSQNLDPVKEFFKKAEKIKKLTLQEITVPIEELEVVLAFGSESEGFNFKPFVFSEV